MPASTASIRLTIASLLLIAAWPAAARWNGKGEAGLAIADGNSDSRTANARITATRKLDAWEHSLGLAGLYVRSGGDTTAKRWEASSQTRLDFKGRNFWYGGARYEQDRFNGFDDQGLLTTGVGRRFIDTDDTKLIGQVGAGYKFWEKLDVPNDKDSRVTGVGRLEFDHRLGATTSVHARFGGEFTSDNNFLHNEVGVAVQMTDRVALSLNYALRHNTDPPAGFKKTDTLTTVNLVYEVN
jgi:putative salt-induced outer membrane protein